jgi:transcriptional regulator with XRE-family HTH domain
MPVDPDKRLGSFGSYLRTLRKGRGMSLQQAVNAICRRAPELRLSVSALSRYEAGEVLDPRPPLLRACAQAYRTPYEQLIAALVADKYGVDLRAPAGGKAAEALPPYGSIAEVTSALGDLNEDGRSAVQLLAESLRRADRFRR